MVQIVLIIAIVYLFISIIVYFLANSNVIPSRRRKRYTVQFNAELKFLPSVINSDLKVGYWVAKQNEGGKNVILLHGFTRTSNRLQSRAQIYWDLGYNLYFVDNLGHGYSSNLLYPSGYRYSIEVKHIIDAENIMKPVIHGLSMGAIASNIIAQRYPDLPQAIVNEALPLNFDNLYSQLLRYLKIPPILFPWIEPVSRRLNWSQFEELGLSEEDYTPWEVICPFFLIHSTTDRLFHAEDHFHIMVTKMTDKSHFTSWLVPDARHTGMNNHPQYRTKLEEFLTNLSE